MTDFDPEDEFVVHVVDAAGNIATYSAKGYLLQFIDVDAGPDQFATATEPVLFTGTISGYGDLVQPARFLWTFGDGATLSGNLDDLILPGSEPGTFMVDHLYAAGGSFEATLRIVDGVGATGFDTTNVYACGDPRDVFLPDATINELHADIRGCTASIEGDSMTITLYMAGDIADEFGIPDPLLGDIQYRLRLGLVGQSNEKLVRYRNGDTTGMRSLNVSLSENAISFEFSLKELGRKGPLSDAAITFSAETRDGAQSTGSAGLLDWMPDDGSVVEFHE
ncbi:MAG: PKD domain-containing protein [Dehalococcoidia bacterium]|nr:PKD domain-containing protein [Dehalococcoidia bacterium]